MQVLTLADDPERPAGDIQQLRVAVVAAHGVGDQELLIVAQAGLQQTAVEGVARRLRVASVQRGGQDIVQAAEIAGIEVAPFQPSGDNAAQVTSDGQPQDAPPAGRHLDGQPRARPQQVRRRFRQAFVRRPAAEQGGGIVLRGVAIRDLDQLAQHAVLAAHGEPSPCGTARFDRQPARLVEADCKDGGFRRRAERVVDFQFGDDRRQQRVAQLRGRCARRVGNPGKRRVDSKGEVVGYPAVGCPAVMAANLAPVIGHNLCCGALIGRPRLLGEEVGRSSAAAGGALEEGQAPQRRIVESVSLLDADEKVLVRRLAYLCGHTAARAEMAAGKAHERAHRRMLRVEADVAGERLE